MVKEKKIKILGTNYKEEFVERAIMFYKHLENHPEVQTAPKDAGIPVCKICDKNAIQIHKDSYHKEESAINDKINDDTEYDETCNCSEVPCIDHDCCCIRCH